MAREQRGWFRRKKGALVYCWNTAEGREKSKVIGPDSMSDADGWIAVGERGLNQLVGKPSAHNDTLGRISDLYLAHGKKKNGEPKAESTKQLHEQLVNKYVRPRFGNRMASEIEPLEVQNWINTLSFGVRPKVRNLMSAIYGYGQKFGFIPRREDCNPMRWVTASQVSDYEAVTLTPAQAWSLAMACGIFVRTLVITVAATGSRISEALGLRWSDFEWHRNQISIKRAWVRGNLGPAKSKASRAPVPMHPLLAAFLQRWREETPYGKDTDWVFPSFKLKGTQPRTATTVVSDYIRPLAVKLGFISEDERRFGFHNLRHSLATFLLEQGENPTLVQKILRHSSLPMTMRYAHMDASRIAAQGKMLEQMVASGEQVV